jgi:hypothetical protein
MKVGQFRTHPNLAAGPLCADDEGENRSSWFEALPFLPAGLICVSQLKDSALLGLFWVSKE